MSGWAKLWSLESIHAFDFVTCGLLANPSCFIYELLAATEAAHLRAAQAKIRHSPAQDQFLLVLGVALRSGIAFLVARTQDETRGSSHGSVVI